MKKGIIILSTIFLIFAGKAYGQYDNFGQMFDIENAIFGKGKIRGDIGYAITRVTYKPKDDTLYTYPRNAITLNLDINFFKHLHLRTAFYIDLSSNRLRPPFLSDFYYQLGWYDWHNKAFSFGYENYQPHNLFKKDVRKTDWVENFRRGMLFASYNIDLINYKSGLKYDNTSQIRIVPGIRYFYEYTDKYGVETAGHNKIVLTTSARWTIVKFIYIEGAVYYYFNEDSKLPWDPDYTYGFGLFDWRAFKVNITYGNWIANRFPWNEKDMKNDFFNGELKATITWAF